MWTVQETLQSFFLTEQETGLVLTSKIENCIRLTPVIVLCFVGPGLRLGSYNGQTDQQWFWDQSVLRSAEYPHKVLTIVNGSLPLSDFDMSESQVFVVKENNVPVLKLYENLTYTKPVFRLGRARDYFYIISKSDSKVLSSSEGDGLQPNF